MVTPRQLAEKLMERPMEVKEIYDLYDIELENRRRGHFVYRKLDEVTNLGYPVYEMGHGLYGVLKKPAPIPARKRSETRWPGQPLCRIPDTNGIGGSWMLP